MCDKIMPGKTAELLKKLHVFLKSANTKMHTQNPLYKNPKLSEV